MKKSNKKLIKN